MWFESVCLKVKIFTFAAPLPYPTVHLKGMFGGNDHCLAIRFYLDYFNGFGKLRDNILPKGAKKRKS